MSHDIPQINAQTRDFFLQALNGLEEPQHLQPQSLKPPHLQPQTRRNASTAPALPTLRIGASGYAVTVLQSKLKEIGYAALIDQDVPGGFGTKTDEAVRKFQESQNMTQNGVVDTAVWGRLGISRVTPTWTQALTTGLSIVSEKVSGAGDAAAAQAPTTVVTEGPPWGWIIGGVAVVGTVIGLALILRK